MNHFGLCATVITSCWMLSNSYQGITSKICTHNINLTTLNNTVAFLERDYERFHICKRESLVEVKKIKRHHSAKHIPSTANTKVKDLPKLALTFLNCQKKSQGLKIGSEGARSKGQTVQARAEKVSVKAPPHTLDLHCTALSMRVCWESAGRFSTGASPPRPGPS